MTVKEFLLRYVVVRKCACCGEILEYERADDAFCPECKLKWRSAMTESCGLCFREISECECMPKRLSAAGALTLRKLAYYSPDHPGEPQNRLIYKLKNNKNDRLSAFVADQLVSRVLKELRNLIDTEDFSNKAIITYVPRSKRARLENGVDHSEQICLRLSEKTGIPFAALITRKKSGKEQKKLTQAERFKNVAELFELAGADVAGKYVMLFDDVVTTGASMTACTKALRRAKAKGILCFCIAYDKMKRRA